MKLTSLFAACAGLGLVAAGLFSAPVAGAADAAISAPPIVVGEPAHLLLSGCEDPAVLSAIVVDVLVGDEVVETVTVKPGTRSVEVGSDEPGEFTAAMTCLTYNGEGTWASARTTFVVHEPLMEPGKPVGTGPICAGGPVTVAGLTGEPGEVVYAALFGGPAGDLLQEWVPAGTIGPDGTARLTLTLAKDVPVGTYYLLAVGTATTSAAIWEIPVPSSSACTKTLHLPAKTSPRPGRVPTSLPSTGV